MSRRPRESISDADVERRAQQLLDVLRHDGFLLTAEQECTAAAVAYLTGLSRKTLRNWRWQVRAGEANADRSGPPCRQTADDVDVYPVRTLAAWTLNQGRSVFACAQHPGAVSPPEVPTDDYPARFHRPAVAESTDDRVEPPGRRAGLRP